MESKRFSIKVSSVILTKIEKEGNLQEKKEHKKYLSLTAANSPVKAREEAKNQVKDPKRLLNLPPNSISSYFNKRSTQDSNYLIRR